MIERLNGKENGLLLPRTMGPDPWLAGESFQTVGLTRQAQISRNLNPQEEERRQVREAGRAFEAYFIAYLFKVMRETIPQGAVANREGVYLNFLSDEEIGRRAAEAGGLGLARLFEVYAEQQRGVGSSGSSLGPS
ncbi:MAG: hypothetical protein NNA18_00600 [Nitrospira sp.]|nr:hypothetical protein [Nitrospira sp.]